jgi:hypothetical protein
LDSEGNTIGMQPIVVEEYSSHWNWQPDVAYNPTRNEYLVVFTYETGIGSGDYDIWAVRLAADGTPLNPKIWVHDTAGIQQDPAVAYNKEGDEYLVVWEIEQGPNTTDIWSRRIAGDGSLQPGPINIATSAADLRTDPDVAYDPGQNQYLIAYTFKESAASDGDIFAVLVSWNLGVRSSEIVLVGNTNMQEDVALAASDDEYLAVWTDGPSTSWRTIYGRRIKGDGSLPGILFLLGEATNKEMSLPAVSYGAGFGYLVSWQYGSQTSSKYDLYGRYLLPGQDQPAAEMFGIDNTAEDQAMPAVACDTLGDCLVVYNDNFGAGDWEVRGRFVRPHHIYLPQVVRNP